MRNTKVKYGITLNEIGMALLFTNMRAAKAAKRQLDKLPAIT